MNMRNLSMYAVSVYVLLFALAVWSVIPSASTGATVAASAVQQQVAACEPGAPDVESQQGPLLPFTERGPVPQNLYACAVLTGNSYN